MDAVRTSETSVYFNENTWRFSHKGHTRRRENVKSHKVYHFVQNRGNITGREQESTPDNAKSDIHPLSITSEISKLFSQVGRLINKSYACDPNFQRWKQFLRIWAPLVYCGIEK
jgi:hypothetical protein